jgi:hypothetical protein
MIERISHKSGVLTNTFKAKRRMPLVSVVDIPPSWSKIVGTAICGGENNIYGDCVTTMAYNAAINAAAHVGKQISFPDINAFQLYEKLGGMPADIGLDPATLWNYWLDNAIGGYKLASIEEIDLSDFNSMKSAIIDLGFFCCTAKLTQAQMTQTAWSSVDSTYIGEHAFCPTWYEGPYLYDDTWGEEIPMAWDFLQKQGVNAWRVELSEI